MSEILHLSFQKSFPSFVLTPAETKTLELPFAQVITAEPGAGTTYTWSQDIPLSVWTVPHNLGRYPSVTVVDSLNNVVEPDVKYIDNNILQVVHGLPYSGKAYLN